MFRAGFIIRILATVAGVTALSSCAASYRNHGYVPTEEELAELVVGVDTRDSVAETIGTPSTSGVLDASGYYYVQSRVRHFAHQRPKVIERQILAISFDGSGTIANIERFALEDGVAVPLQRRVTSSSVANKGFFRQLLGNLGRFNAGDFFQ